MSVSTPKTCKCGKTMFYAKSDKGQILPLDAKAPVYKIDRDLTGELVATRIEGYVSHFSTCPNANEFSKKKQ